MKMKLKEGTQLDPINNHYGLSLCDFYKLNAGEGIDIETVPEELKTLTTTDEKPKKKEPKNGD